MKRSGLPVALLFLTSVFLVSIAIGPASTAKCCTFSYSSPQEIVYAPNGYLYVTDGGSNYVSVVDPSGPTIVGQITVGSNPDGIAYASSNGDLYVVDSGGITPIDTSTDTPLSPLGFGPGLQGIVFDPSNGYVYFTNPTGKDIGIIDSASNTLVGSFATFPYSPLQIAYDPSNGFLYVGTSSDSVLAIDPDTGTIVARMSAGNYPGGIAIDPVTNDIYVVNVNDASVSVMDGSNNSPSWTIPLDTQGGTDVTYSESNGYIYASSFQLAGQGGVITAIDTNDNMIVQRITVGQSPDGMALDPSNDKLYVANSGSNSISVIDASPNPALSGLSGILSGIGTIETSLGALSTDLSNDFGSLQTSITSLSSSLSTLSTEVNSIDTTLTTDFASLSGQLTSLSASLSAGFSGLSAQMTSLSSSLSSDFATLSSQIANIGTSGPTVGTSNDAATATSASFSSRATFSSTPSTWTLVSGSAGTDRVISGYALSVTAGSTRNAVLYISLTNSPSSVSSTYAIPIGGINILTTSNGQLRFPFKVPSGSSVYVQVVSANGATVTVQLQTLNLPIAG